ncbi:MAG: exonuclease domain-containing protein [bacterium]
MKKIFFDTETTGNTPGDYICQLAYKTSRASMDTARHDSAESETFCELFKPLIPIPPEASAITHITNKHVADMPEFKSAPCYRDIKALFEDPDSIAIAHNAKFDLGMLAKEDIVPSHFICTLRLARFLDTENALPQYKLQYLRYKLDIDIEATAHDALGDVLVLEALFPRLEKKFIDRHNGDEKAALQEMLEVSSRPSLMSKFGFGKYRDQKVVDVASDKGYFQWLLDEKKKNNPDDEDWIYTLEYYLKA